ncbi:MAG: class I SAM-dependent rRNA methyltransferase [Bacteroidales bacterium]|nr:class I SAM-dependent rRNA methyltransferase [Bacteroidales bacterium]
MTRFYLKKGREESLRRFHPWVFSGAIDGIDGPDPEEGDIVSVYSSKGEFLGWGHYQIGSISVRILSFEDDKPAGGTDSAFWLSRLRGALEMRKACVLGGGAGSSDSGIAGTGGGGSAETTCYRLVHGEGDSLPGLVIDWYDGVCVLQAHSVGMFLARHQIADALRQLYGDSLQAVYDKSSGTAPFKAGLELGDGYLWRRDTSTSLCPRTVRENGHLFEVDWETGQKTGFFLDQRDNRALVERLARGRRVLNLFCYTGGFSVYALAGGAVKVDSVDSSSKAVKLVDRNVLLNFGPDAPHRSLCCDAIDFVKEAPSGEYDLMIVDPPAFAKHRGALGNALRAYQRLNAAAISAVASGGIVLTFSCSQVVDREQFALAVFSAAAETGRRVRIIDRLCQPADHAVNIYHPEGAYLKGLVLYVE